MAPRGPRTTPFGSVWDSQLGTSAAPAAANLSPLSDDDEDFDEPEIPEYLIAEQRRGARPGGARGGQGGGRGGPRGGRAAYQSAVERERYGRGGGGGGINRYPDVSGRTGGGGNVAPSRPPRDDRGYGRRDERPREAAPRPSSSNEPWSEVPPELEAVLRAQVGQKPSPGDGTIATDPAGAVRRRRSGRAGRDRRRCGRCRRGGRAQAASPAQDDRVRGVDRGRREGRGRRTEAALDPQAGSRCRHAAAASAEAGSTRDGGRRGTRPEAAGVEQGVDGRRR